MKRLIIFICLISAIPAQTVDTKQRTGVNSSVISRTFFGTAAPDSVTGNLAGDYFSDTTNHNLYQCNAVSGTSAPACTSVATGAWTLINGSGILILIQDQVVGSAVPTVTFSSIPGTYKHLKLIINARSSTSAGIDIGYVQMNGDTGANYSVQTVSGNGSTSGAGQVLSAAKTQAFAVPAATSPANDSGNAELTFVDYANTTFNKVVVGSYGGVFGTTASAIFAFESTYKWANTAAITQFTCGLTGAGNFITGSRFTLYGLN